MSADNDARIAHFRQAGYRAISRWLDPLPEESIHGFFLRLADEHLQSSARSFADEFDLDIDWGDPTPLMAAVSGADYGTDRDRTMLRAWTARIEGSFAFIGQERIARGDFSLRTRRFCPGCLAESAHHRSWFDMQFMSTCPFHGTEIIDCVGDSFKANWRHPGIDHLATGESLAWPLPRLKTTPTTLEAYVLGRYGVLPKTEIPLLDGEALNDVIGAAETVGRLAIGGYMTTMPYVDAKGFARPEVLRRGYDVLRQGRGALKTLLQKIARKAPPLAYGTEVLFGCAYGYLAPRPGVPTNPIEAIVFELMKEIGRELGRRGRHHTDPKPSPDSTFVTISELAAEIERTPDAVYLVARSLGVLERHPGTKGFPRLIARRHLADVRKVMARTLTREAAAAYLAIPPAAFDQVVLSGHLVKADARWSETGRNCDTYDRAEIDRFLDTIPVTGGELPTTATRAAPFGLLNLPDLLAQTTYDAGGFLGEVFAGRLCVTTRTNRSDGLASFWVDPMEQPWNHHFTARCHSLQVTRSVPRYDDGMSIGLASAVLEVGAGTIKALLEKKLIRQVARKGGTKRNSLDKLSVFSLAGRCLAAKFYADAFDCPPHIVTRRAAVLGIEPILPTTNRGTQRVAPIFDRRVMRDALGLRFDPDHDDIAREGWKDLAERLDEANSLFSLLNIVDDLSAMFCTNDAEWPITITYDLLDDIPTFGLEAEVSYTIRAVFEISGKKARKRIDDIEAVLKTRHLHPLVEAEVNREAGICRASTKAHIVNRCAYNSSGREIIWLRAADDAVVVNRLLTLLKCSLEVGPRPYDARLFGSASPFYYRA